MDTEIKTKWIKETKAKFAQPMLKQKVREKLDCNLSLSQEKSLLIINQVSWYF